MECIIRRMLTLSRENTTSNRSTRRTNYLHASLCELLSETVPGRGVIEEKVPSGCSGGFKNCDIVFFSGENKISHIFPVKAPLSNINKNLNNYEEQLRGEVAFLRDLNPDVAIEPINIYPLSCRNGLRTETLNVDRFLNSNKSWCDDIHTILWSEDENGFIHIDNRSISSRFENKMF